jgi:hypothetical protein
MQKCQAITAGQTALKDRIIVQSCYQANIQLLHQNFVSTR